MMLLKHQYKQYHIFIILLKTPLTLDMHIKRFDIKKEFLFIPMFNPGCFLKIYDFIDFI